MYLGEKISFTPEAPRNQKGSLLRGRRGRGLVVEWQSGKVAELQSGKVAEWQSFFVGGFGGRKDHPRHLLRVAPPTSVPFANLLF